jgi:hypothetical protein
MDKIQYFIDALKGNTDQPQGDQGSLYNKNPLANVDFQTLLRQIGNNAYGTLRNVGTPGAILRAGIKEAGNDPMVQRLSFDNANKINQTNHTLSQAPEDYKSWSLGGEGAQTAGNLIGDPFSYSGLGGPAASIVKAGARELAPTAGRMAENYMFNNGLALSAVPKTKTSVLDELLGQFPTTTAGKIVNMTKARGGYSVNLPTGDIPNQGLMMGMYKNSDPRNSVVEGMINRADVAKQTEMNANQLNNPENYFGSWHNPEENKTYLDVSKRFEPNELRKAVKFGERTGQLAGYDVGANAGKGDTFPVGNWNEFINSPEYAQRLTNLNKTGVDYLAQHPTINWWDLHGTPLEDIYGKENLPQVAGYLAATSPVSDVPRNARIASEYMRRHIAGEPIIQPDFRMPSNAVFEAPGNMMPMETGRANNLIAAQEGRIPDMRKEKVRSMAQALMGDPNAMVFDRHWANLSEKPSENIYTGIEKGVFPSGKQYSALEEIVANQAKQAGMSPRDFSANVWTGYRDAAQKNKSVFGQKTAGSGIQGESKSIADTFLDQLKIKSEKLGIPYDDMIKKLKSGEMSLLSVLGIPAIPKQNENN